MMDGMMQGDMMSGGMMGGMMIVWGLLSLVLLISLIVLIILAATSLIRRMREPMSDRTVEMPLDIIKRRLAQGELTLEQFETMKNQLQEK
ncbi:MAG TPA: hypothetical protein P5121_00445 [Caldilineaceae bacterium]|nr:hypothetical protein [Caldilineaceae bacterium]